MFIAAIKDFSRALKQFVFTGNFVAPTLVQDLEALAALHNSSPQSCTFPITDATAPVVVQPPIITTPVCEPRMATPELVQKPRVETSQFLQEPRVVLPTLPLPLLSTMSPPGVIAKALQRFAPHSTAVARSPPVYQPPRFGAAAHTSDSLDTSPPLTADEHHNLQQLGGVLLYYCLQSIKRAYLPSLPSNPLLLTLLN